MSLRTDKTDKKKKELIAALQQNLGIVTDACKQVNITRDTYYRWLKEDEEFKKKVDELEDIALDFAESMLLKKIKEGDTTAIIFYMKTKGKKRGYIEKHEVDSNVAGTLTIVREVITSNKN